MKAQQTGYLKTREAIVLIQSGWRGLKARRLCAEKVNSIVVVQAQVQNVVNKCIEYLHEKLVGMK